MVKNKTGGRNHKKMASKYASEKEHRATLRLAKDDDEMYGRVTKLYGNGMADVLCNDKVNRLLQIRKKFRGRNKRDNTISLDSLVLVGARSWEALNEKKKPKADLLYVYSENQYENLKNVPEIYEILPDTNSYKDENGGFVFSEKPTWLIEKEQQEAKAAEDALRAEEEKAKKEKEELEKPIEKDQHLKSDFAWDLDDDDDDDNFMNEFIDSI
jgi:initiation factor 1A|tara:strand:+ start:336 stop:974 length:639 start_codon:yes stop_codon:yes gene_type:complete